VGLTSRANENMKERVRITQNNIKIILSSVEESVVFYENYGFKWTKDSITQHNMLMRFEKYDPKKEYFIMELSLENK
jgi:anaerobic ribonucleoside-triphosphate reductase